MSAGFAIGRYALDDPQFAVFAGFTAMALLAFADYGGPMRSRLLAFAVTVAVAIGLVSLGTAVSESSWGGPVAVGAAAVVVAYAAVLGGYFVAGTNAVILFAVLAAGIPAPDGALDSRVVGTLLGGALAAAASVLLWPARPVRDAGRPLGKAAAALAACLGAGAADREASLAAARTEVRAARARLGDLATGPPSRPPGTAPSSAWSPTSTACWAGSPGWSGTGRPRQAPARGSSTRRRPGWGRLPPRWAGGARPSDPVALERRCWACVPEARAALAARVVEADPGDRRARGGGGGHRRARSPRRRPWPRSTRRSWRAAGPRASSRPSSSSSTSPCSRRRGGGCAPT